MKTLIWKLVLCFSLSTIAFNTYADWQCSVIDKGGHRWQFSGMTEDHANQVAMSFCTAYSPNSSSCHLAGCNEQG